MGARPQDDDRPTVDLGPRPLETEGPEETQDLGAASSAYDDGDDDDDSDAPRSIDQATHTVRAHGSRGPVQGSVHALPTQQIPLAQRQARRGSTGSASLTKHGDSTASPIEAMRLDEIARTRVFLRVVLAISIGGIVVALIAKGDPVARNVVLVGTACAMIGASWMLFAIRDVTKYDLDKLVLPGVMMIFGTMSGVYYWGTASPVAAMVVFGIYFFGLGSNVRVTVVMFLLVAVTHGVLGMGILLGLLEDRGLIQMSSLRAQDQLSLVCIIEFLYIVAFLTARASQRVTLDAMTKLQQAARNVAQRDALLAEARAELDRALKIGGPGRFSEQVVGSYKLGVLIGRGGMGEVYEAHGTADNREAAVKLLHPGTLAEPTHVQRFLREAEMASRLDCANVVRVLEVGTTAGEVPFIAMERLRGNDLAHQLRRHRKLGLPAVRQVADQVSVGLEAARAAGIVHRDLKPHNVFFAEDSGVRRWKILDFGVSKAGGTGTLTKGHVVGTPAYMAPEQARGEDVDHRADVYSLAAILYRAITGHPAFTGKDVPSTLYDVVYRVPTQPSILVNTPADIDRVLAIGLAKDPADRFATAVELARWFAAAVDGGLEIDERRRADDVIAKYPWGTRPGAAAIQS